MSLPSNTPPSQSLRVLKIILYILAIIILIPGLIAGISLMTGASIMVENILLPLNLLGGEITYNMLAPTLIGFFINLGVILLILSLVASALLYGLGRLIGQILMHEERLTRLETGS